MPPTVALTGASGFIGRTIAQHLCQAGFMVRGLVRPPRSTQDLQDLGVELVQGSLDNQESLLNLVKDCVGVVHCAGAIRGISREDFRSTNVSGVSHLIQACLTQPSPPRFVLLSSLAARNPSLSPYAWSKREGEKVLAREAQSMEWVTFRPPAVYGPNDRVLRPLFQLLQMGFGIQLGSQQTKFSLIDVDDLSEVILLWLKKNGVPFKIFEVDDGFPGGYSWEEVFRYSKHPLRLRLHLPPTLLKFLSSSNEVLSRIFRYAPIFTTGKVAELLHPNWVCNNADVTKALGWNPQISLEEGLRRLFTSDRLTSSREP
ncbi:MAG: NAD-dependent epimerase/dehydratase family protein [Nitrospirales bacterium]